MIFALLNNLKKQSFTGIAHIKTKVSNNTNWQIYFNEGKLFWASGGIHSHRSWQRHLSKYCPKVDLKQVNFRDSEKYKCSEYSSLIVLLKQNLSTPENIQRLVVSKIIEVFFDIFQQEKSTPLELEAEKASLSTLIGETSNHSLISINIESAFKQMQQQWSAWIQSGFTSVYPDHAPKIKSREQLEKAVPTVVYQNFVKLLDGRRSLRDLAVGMNKDLLLLTKSIYPYVHKGLLELVKVPDQNSVNSKTNSANKPIASGNNHLIACIDDSPQICQIMNQIIVKAGYRFLGIQQPIQAVPKLIGVNPKMIFLDIGMPILNGYEVCTQIRRVSKLQEVPIIMLTGNDGVFDRVKAKVCGASDFLSKPIEVDKILQTIDKFSAANAPTMMISS
ncbi:response regulator [Pleurocapsales cyanobacterium LEGE 10410]|nr:response regulator [Pleurocapsales cyanobacterium LEGE 10410]